MNSSFMVACARNRGAIARVVCTFHLCLGVM